MKVVGNAKFNALTKSGPSTGAYNRHKTAVDCTPNDGAVAASQVATFDPGFEAGVGVGVQQHVDCTPAGTVLKVSWTPFAGGRTGFGGTFAYPATQGSFLIEGCVGTSPLLHLQSGVEYTPSTSPTSPTGTTPSSSSATGWACPMAALATAGTSHSGWARITRSTRRTLGRHRGHR